MLGLWCSLKRDTRLTIQQLERGLNVLELIRLKGGI